MFIGQSQASLPTGMGSTTTPPPTDTQVFFSSDGTTPVVAFNYATQTLNAGGANNSPYSSTASPGFNNFQFQAFVHNGTGNNQNVDANLNLDNLVGTVVRILARANSSSDWVDIGVADESSSTNNGNGRRVRLQVEDAADSDVQANLDTVQVGWQLGWRIQGPDVVVPGVTETPLITDVFGLQDIAFYASADLTDTTEITTGITIDLASRVIIDTDTLTRFRQAFTETDPFTLVIANYSPDVDGVTVNLPVGNGFVMTEGYTGLNPSSRGTLVAGNNNTHTFNLTGGTIGATNGNANGFGMPPASATSNNNTAIGRVVDTVFYGTEGSTWFINLSGTRGANFEFAGNSLRNSVLHGQGDGTPVNGLSFDGTLRQLPTSLSGIHTAYTYRMTNITGAAASSNADGWQPLIQNTFNGTGYTIGTGTNHNAHINANFGANANGEAANDRRAYSINNLYEAANLFVSRDSGNDGLTVIETYAWNPRFQDAGSGARFTDVFLVDLPTVLQMPNGVIDRAVYPLDGADGEVASNGYLVQTESLVVAGSRTSQTMAKSIDYAQSTTGGVANSQLVATTATDVKIKAYSRVIDTTVSTQVNRLNTVADGSAISWSQEHIISGAADANLNTRDFNTASLLNEVSTLDDVYPVLKSRWVNNGINQSPLFTQLGDTLTFNDQLTMGPNETITHTADTMTVHVNDVTGSADVVNLVFNENTTLTTFELTGNLNLRYDDFPSVLSMTFSGNTTQTINAAAFVNDCTFSGLTTFDINATTDMSNPTFSGDYAMTIDAALTTTGTADFSGNGRIDVDFTSSMISPTFADVVLDVTQQLDLTGTSIFGGVTNITGGAVINANNTTFSGTNSIVANQPLTLTGANLFSGDSTLDLNANTTINNGTFSGPYDVVVDASLTLTGTSLFSGDGVLTINSSSSLGSPTFSGSTEFTIGAGVGLSNAIFSGGGSVELTTGSAVGSLTGATISGSPLVLTNSSSGIWTLSGATSTVGITLDGAFNNLSSATDTLAGVTFTDGSSIRLVQAATDGQALDLEAIIGASTIPSGATVTVHAQGPNTYETAGLPAGFTVGDNITIVGPEVQETIVRINLDAQPTGAVVRAWQGATTTDNEVTATKTADPLTFVWSSGVTTGGTGTEADPYPLLSTTTVIDVMVGETDSATTAWRHTVTRATALEDVAQEFDDFSTTRVPDQSANVASAGAANTAGRSLLAPVDSDVDNVIVSTTTGTVMLDGSDRVILDVSGFPDSNPATEAVTQRVFASVRNTQNYLQAIRLKTIQANDPPTASGNSSIDVMQFTSQLYVNMLGASTVGAGNGSYILVDMEDENQKVSGVYDTGTAFAPRIAENDRIRIVVGGVHGEDSQEVFSRLRRIGLTESVTEEQIQRIVSAQLDQRLVTAGNQTNLSRSVGAVPLTTDVQTIDYT